MKYITAIIIMGFVGMLAIGFIPMSHNNYHEMGKVENPCPIATLFNAACTPDEAMMAIIHASALQSFSHAPIPVIFLVLLGLVGFTVWLYLSSLRISFPRLFIFTHRHFWRYVYSSLSDKIRFWLSLFEHSPSFV